MENGKEIEVTLKIKLKTTVENVKDNDKDTVKFLVEEDLENLGYEVENIEILEESNELFNCNLSQNNKCIHPFSQGELNCKGTEQEKSKCTVYSEIE